MWNATIESKTFVKGILQIGVIYSNGVENFTESYLIYTESNIDNYISSKLNQMNLSSSVDTPLGQYLPKPEVFENDGPKNLAVENLRKLQELVNFGVIKETDQKVLDALQAVKDLI